MTAFVPALTLFLVEKRTGGVTNPRYNCARKLPGELLAGIKVQEVSAVKSFRVIRLSNRVANKPAAGERG